MSQASKVYSAAAAELPAVAAGRRKFTIDPLVRSERFLVLGSSAGTYYCADPKVLTLENAEALSELIRTGRGLELVALIRKVSTERLAYRQSPTLFALALCTRCEEDAEVRAAALATVAAVCRTLTMLAEFLTYHQAATGAIVKSTGWGRGLKRAIAEVVNGRSAKELAYAVTKYKQRNGWRFRDVLRKGHPVPASAEHDAVLRYVVKGTLDAHILALDSEAVAFLRAVDEVKTATDERLVALVTEYRLAWEHMPSERLTIAPLWQAMVRNGMPITALLRNLGRMTANGAIAPLSDVTAAVCERLQCLEGVHPMQVLLALKTYGQGHGHKGKLRWQPVQTIVAALDAAFVGSFKSVVPTGKKIYHALDVSASMRWEQLACGGISSAEAAAAMLMVGLRTERQTVARAFSSRMVPIPDVTGRSSLAEILRQTKRISAGGTDCALPMLDALENRLDVDAFVVYTDNETWAGDVTPTEALHRYRTRMNKPDAKLVVVGMTSNGFSIADPNDPRTLDVVGFSADAPMVIADHIRRC